MNYPFHQSNHIMSISPQYQVPHHPRCCNPLWQVKAVQYKGSLNCRLQNIKDNPDLIETPITGYGFTTCC